MMRKPKRQRSELGNERLARRASVALLCIICPAAAWALGEGSAGLQVFEATAPTAVQEAVGEETLAPGTEGSKILAGIALSATFSDNANLDTASRDKESEIFLQALPYVLFNAAGARVKGRGYYGPAFYTGTIGSAPANVAHFLDATGTAELVPDTFFIDAGARASMQANNSFGGGTLGTGNYLYDSNNVDQVYGLRISPYLQHRFGATADGYARVDWAGTWYDSNNGSDNSFNNAFNNRNDSQYVQFETGLNSGDEFQKVPWRIYYRDRQVSNDQETLVNNNDDSYRRVEGLASYVISPMWRLNGSLGQEWNDYFTAPGGKTDGTIWTAGATWTPNERIYLSGAYGERFFGPTWFLDFSYQHQRTRWFANYRTELTTTTQQYVDSTSLFFTDASGVPIVDPNTGQPVLLVGANPARTNQTYVLDTFRNGVVWTGDRTVVLVDLVWNRYDYQVTSRSDYQEWGAGARVTRDLAANLQGTALFEWTKNDYDNADVNSPNRWQAGLLLSRKIGRQSSVSASYARRQNVFTTVDGDSGNENRVSLVFNHAF